MNFSFFHIMVVEGSIEYQFTYYGPSTAPCISSWLGSFYAADESACSFTVT